MKYILIFLLALLCSVGYAQFPVNQYMGSQTTLVTARGGLKADSSLILPQFPDTTAANRSPYIKFYPGNLIRVFNDIYMRNTTATKWELINGGGTGGNNFIDSLRKVGDSVFARKYGVFVYQYTDSAQKILANNGLSFSGDTLQLGGRLSKNTTINQAGNDIIFDSSNQFKVIDVNGYDRIKSFGNGTFIQQKSSNDEYANGLAYSGEAGTFFQGYAKSNDKESRIDVTPDSIRISPNNGIINIDSLQANIDTTGYYPLKWNATTGKVEAYTGGFASNVLANNGLSKSVDTVQLGGSLIKNTVINGSSNQLLIDSISSFTLNNKIGQINLGTDSSRAFLRTATNYGNASILDLYHDGIDGQAAIYTFNSTKASEIRLTTDSIKITAQDSIISLDGVKTNSDTANYLPLMWNPNVKRLEAYKGGFGNLGVDTTSLSNRINSKIDSLMRSNDSVYARKNGQFIFQFRDSVGGAGGGGGGGGKIYYFNGGVSMGTFAGVPMYELGDTAVIGTAANFTRNTVGNIANFITDIGKPGLLQIPAGVWTIDAYLSETGGGSNSAQIYAKLEVWNGISLTVIATSPIEEITSGSTPNLYTFSISVPTTAITVTDRIVIQFYIQNNNGKTVTLYTQNGYVGEVHTTFTTGIGSLNGLVTPSQVFATGTAGTDFGISSAVSTHTFNLPTASATNRGALSSADWTTFNGKVSPSDTANKWITNVFRKTASDSVFFVRGGTNNFAFRDSTGSALAIGTAITSATAGSVLFAGVGGRLQQSNSRLFYDSANSKLTIGPSAASPTNFPSTTLQLNGNGIGTTGRTALAVTTSNSSSAASFILQNSGSKRLISQISSNGYVIGEKASIYTEGGTNLEFASDFDVSTGGTNRILWTTGGFNSSPTMSITGGNPGSILIGTTTDVPSSQLTVTSTTKGFLQPRLTTTQMNAISTPATGLSVFNTTDSLEYTYRGTGSGWQKNVTYTRTNDIGLLNGADQRVMIEPSTNIVAGRALTVEAGSTQAGGTSAFQALSQTTRNWYHMAAAPNGDIYAVVFNGDIYRRTGGTGNFIGLGQTTRAWVGIAVASNGDIYASVNGGDLYKSTGGAFTTLSAGNKNWWGMCVAPNGDVYAVVQSGDIWKSTNGGTTFTALGQTTRGWIGIAAAPNGDIYASVAGGDIYKQTGGTGNFIALGQNSRSWYSITTASNGDIYAAVLGGDIYRQIGGTGNFIALSQTSRNWNGIAAAPNGDIYASVQNGDIYLQSAGTANLNGGTLVLQSGVGKGTGTSTINFNTGTTLTSGATLQTASTKMTVLGNGNVGIGTTSPNAKLELSDTARGFLQPRMTTTQRTNISSPAVGLQVFTTTDSSNYVYRGSGAGWQQVANEIFATASLNFASTNAQNSSDLTITLTGAVDGDAVVLGVPNAAVNANSCYTAWVSAANTVTVRFNNYSSGAIDPAQATFKVTIIK